MMRQFNGKTTYEISPVFLRDNEERVFIADRDEVWALVFNDEDAAIDAFEKIITGEVTL